MPPRGVKLSWLLSTAPSPEPVETAANSALRIGPKRTSLPSMLPPAATLVRACETPTAARAGLPACSSWAAAAVPARRRVHMARKMTTPWRMLPTRRPIAMVSARGTMRRSRTSIWLVSPVGFSNGCAELALKKPPPSPLMSLITSNEATGPCAMTWVAPSSVRVSAYWCRFCTTPSEARTRAPTRDRGSRTYRIERMRSTQKLPMPRDCWRLNPRQRHSDSHARTGGQEHQTADGEHLGQVGHRLLAGVTLPARVGREADGGVEAEVRRRRGEAPGVQRQPVLEAEQHVAEQRGDDRDDERAEEIGRPPLVVVLADADEPVDTAFQGPEQRGQEGRPPLVDPRHEEAERPGRETHGRIRHPDSQEVRQHGEGTTPRRATSAAALVATDGGERGSGDRWVMAPGRRPAARLLPPIYLVLSRTRRLGRPRASTGRHLRNLPPDLLTTDAAVRLVRRTTLVHAHHPRRRRLNSGSTKRPEARAPGPSPARHKNAPHGQAGQGSAVGWLALAGVDSV